MKILVAEDDPTSRRLLQAVLVRSGHEVVAAGDGVRALEILRSPGAPRLAVLDWMMPGLDGLEICQRVREGGNSAYVFIILLTAKGSRDDVVAGLEAGADDYITKPFHPHELRARIATGTRILDLESALTARVRELQEALVHVKHLQGLLPICMHCKRIRDDTNTWRQIEEYIAGHSEAEFSHSLCNECLLREYPDLAAEIQKAEKR